MEMDFQREVDQLLAEEHAAHVGDLALEALHKYEDILHKELNMY